MCRLKESSEATVRTLVDMEGSYLSANFFREIVAAESFSYDPSRPKPQFVTLTGAGGHAAESNTHMSLVVNVYQPCGCIIFLLLLQCCLFVAHVVCS